MTASASKPSTERQKCPMPGSPAAPPMARNCGPPPTRRITVPACRAAMGMPNNPWYHASDRAGSDTLMVAWLRAVTGIGGPPCASARGASAAAPRAPRNARLGTRPGPRAAAGRRSSGRLMSGCIGFAPVLGRRTRVAGRQADPSPAVVGRPSRQGSRNPAERQAPPGESPQRRFPPRRGGGFCGRSEMAPPGESPQRRFPPPDPAVPTPDLCGKGAVPGRPPARRRWASGAWVPLGRGSRAAPRRPPTAPAPGAAAGRTRAGRPPALPAAPGPRSGRPARPRSSG